MEFKSGFSGRSQLRGQWRIFTALPVPLHCVEVVRECDALSYSHYDKELALAHAATKREGICGHDLQWR